MEWDSRTAEKSFSELKCRCRIFTLCCTQTEGLYTVADFFFRSVSTRAVRNLRTSKRIINNLFTFIDLIVPKCSVSECIGTFIWFIWLRRLFFFLLFSNKHLPNRDGSGGSANQCSHTIRDGLCNRVRAETGARRVLWRPQNRRGARADAPKPARSVSACAGAVWHHFKKVNGVF